MAGVLAVGTPVNCYLDHFLAAVDRAVCSDGAVGRGHAGAAAAAVEAGLRLVVKLPHSSEGQRQPSTAQQAPALLWCGSLGQKLMKRCLLISVRLGALPAGARVSLPLAHCLVASQAKLVQAVAAMDEAELSLRFFEVLQARLRRLAQPVGLTAELAVRAAEQGGVTDRLVVRDLQLVAGPACPSLIPAADPPTAALLAHARRHRDCLVATVCRAASAAAALPFNPAAAPRPAQSPTGAPVDNDAADSGLRVTIAATLAEGLLACAQSACGPLLTGAAGGAAALAAACIQLTVSQAALRCTVASLF